ncbi:MAG: N-acetylglucosamine transport system permease protein [Micromonosporaceae bacterium]
MRHGQYRFIAGFLAIPVALYAFFMVWPYIQDVFYSFDEWNGLDTTPKFIGLGNYSRLLRDDNFRGAVVHNAFFLLILPVVTIVLALFLAFMLNVGGRGGGAGVQGVRGSSVYKVVLFFPQVLSVAIIVILYQSIFQTDGTGLANAILIKLHIISAQNPILWFNDEHWVRWCLLWVLVWSGFGFYMVLFSAAMQSIPRDIFEAALLDGASRSKQFFRVTLPLLWDTVSVAWVYLGFIALDCFALVYALTPGPGGPNHASQVMSTYFFHTAFQNGQYGYACAMGVALAVFSLILAVIQLRVTRRDAVEF